MGRKARDGGIVTRQVDVVPFSAEILGGGSHESLCDLLLCDDSSIEEKPLIRRKRFSTSRSPVAHQWCKPPLQRLIRPVSLRTLAVIGRAALDVLKVDMTVVAIHTARMHQDRVRGAECLASGGISGGGRGLTRLLLPGFHGRRSTICPTSCDSDLFEDRAEGRRKHERADPECLLFTAVVEDDASRAQHWKPPIPTDVQLHIQGRAGNAAQNRGRRWRQGSDEAIDEGSKCWCRSDDRSSPNIDELVRCVHQAKTCRGEASHESRRGPHACGRSCFDWMSAEDADDVSRVAHRHHHVGACDRVFHGDSAGTVAAECSKPDARAPKTGGIDVRGDGSKAAQKRECHRRARLELEMERADRGENEKNCR